MLSTRCVRLQTWLAAAMRLAQKLSRPCSWSRRLVLQLRTCPDAPGPTYMTPGAQLHTTHTAFSNTVCAQPLNGCCRAQHKHKNTLESHFHLCCQDPYSISVCTAMACSVLIRCPQPATGSSAATVLGRTSYVHDVSADTPKTTRCAVRAPSCSACDL